MDAGFNTLFKPKHEPTPSAIANGEHAFISDPVHVFEVHLAGVTAGGGDFPPKIRTNPFPRAIDALPEDSLMGQ